MSDVRTPSQAATILRRWLEGHGCSIVKAAEIAEVTRSTLNAWLTGANQLDPAKGSHREAIGKIAKHLGENIAEMDAPPPQAQAIPPLESYDLLELFLSALLDPESPKEAKVLAADAIRRLCRT